MGASSSGLLDEVKINHIKGLVDNTLQSFSEFYRQQHSAAYFGHLHQEVEPKKEERGQLLTHRPQYAPEEVLYQGSVKFSGWDEQGKKCRERYIVLRRDYKVEIHENMETFNRGCAAKLVLQPAGGNVLTREEESRVLLEQTCAGILNGVKEDSSSVVSSPDVFPVYLHLPYTGHTCFLFQQEEKRDRFLSALKTCIRHCNLDPWCDSSYESQAYVQALRLYRQDKGCYESWEILLGTEEQVLASQVMEEVLPWLQSQLQSRVKGKKAERIRQWLATVHTTYTLVLEQLTAGLETLRGECRQTAKANQALIRSDLDQIMSSHCYLEEKVRACICEEAEKVCNESVAPYMSSILEALTEHISAGIQGMQHTLHTQMDAAFTHTNGGTEETKKALSTLRSISLDHCYRQVENLTEKLQDLKQRFGLSSAQRLVHSAHLEMEQLLDNAIYTLELFLRSSTRLQPSQVPVKMERAKERVLKQLDYDSRVVQRRIYQEALLEITRPALIRGMDSKWKSEFQQFEQYIFSDYSSFILVHNVYDDVLRNILSKEIETVVQDTASKKINNFQLNTSDLAISQYSLLGHTPPLSAPQSPAFHARDSSTVPSGDKESAPMVEEGGKESAPLVEEGGKESAPVVEEGGKESAPVVEGGKESAPMVEEGCKESAPMVEDGGKESAPLVEGGKESAPLVEEGGKESAPVVEDGGKESAPLVEGGDKESAPMVEDGGKESAPLVEEGSKESAPLVEEGSKESAPLVEGGKESAPLVEEGGKESAPVVEDGGKESAPLVEGGDKESAPMVEEGGKESAPMVEEGSKESAPLVEEGSKESAPLVEGGDKESAPMVEEGGKESAPVVEDGGKESAPLVEEGGKESVPMVEDGGKESAPVVEEGGKESAPLVEDGGKESVPMVEDGGKESAPDVEDGGKETAPLVEDGGKESATLVEEGGQSVTVSVGPQSNVQDISTTHSSVQSRVLLSPVIIVTQQFDESTTEEASCFEVTREDVQLATDTPTEAESSNSATSDSDAAVTPEPPTVPESSTPIPVSPDPSASPLSPLQPADVLAECAQSEQSAAPENSAVPDLTASNQISEDASSIQPSSPSTPHTDSPMRISLGSLSEAIGCNSTAPSVTQMVVQQPTDRAVYLTGEIKDNWEMERVKKEKQKEAAEEEDDRIKEQKEEAETREEKEEEIEKESDEGKTGGEHVDDCCVQIQRITSRESHCLNSDPRAESEEKVDEEKSNGTEKSGEEEDEEEQKQDHEKKAEEEVLESSKPMESQAESDAELPLDSVAIIRDLVTEIIEVETVVSPCPNSS